MNRRMWMVMAGISTIVVTVLAGGGGEKSRGWAKSGTDGTPGLSSETRAESESDEQGAESRVATPVDGIISNMVPIPGRNYRMGRTEVTQAQWEAVMGNNPSLFKGPDRPVESVSWDDCQAFIAKLNETPAVKKAKLCFRLPTEEEWEHACLAGGTRYWGRRKNNGTEGPLDAMGWYRNNSGGETHPVAQKEPNAWGLYDMHGNVWEWASTAGGSLHVNRGGSWGSDAGFCRSTGTSHSVRSRRPLPPSCLGLRLLASRMDEGVKAPEAAEVSSPASDAGNPAVLPAQLRSQRELRSRLLKLRSQPLDQIMNRIMADMVQIPGRDYRMGKTEVTQAQWEAVMGSNPSHFRGRRHPVENVSWDDCQAFIAKLNETPAVKKAGLRFRLPTEEEWEHACRAGGTGDWGRREDGEVGPLDTMGWYGDNSGGETHPVAQKKPNAWGLYDMHGNVEEWTSTAEDSYRVGRGGGWGTSAQGCRSADRYRIQPSCRDGVLGFRLLASRMDEGVKAPEAAEVSTPASDARKSAVLPAQLRSQRELRRSQLLKLRSQLQDLIMNRIMADMVQIPGRDYRMGKTEVTQAQWEAVMGNNPSYFRGRSYPVENVSWDDCQAFIAKLNETPSVKKAGLRFRLPTEEEWEHACRAGGTGDWGRREDGEVGPLDTMGWYGDNSGGETHPVAQKKPNAWGLYDMHGNVEEWTSTAEDSYRVGRGGGWGTSAQGCRSADRYRIQPSSRCTFLGFRLCCSAGPRE